VVFLVFLFTTYKRGDFQLFLDLCCQGVGRRYSHIVCRKANVDLTKRAGELSEEEVIKQHHH